ncbi:MAG: adenylate/guanylate cyclase domain-containing protein, partial [SAR324 cluster bacterium]|nr:adenylate/guanylate cyclase domain-containing protein [SAR324 cluster bacterium]
QRQIASDNEALSDPRKMSFRIGINLGDVVEEPDSIYGDGVTVAARLETLAEPGGICIARSVHEQVEGKLPVEFESLGEHPVKTQTVRAYRVVVPEGAEMPPAGAQRESADVPSRKPRRMALIAAAAVVVLVAGGVGVWFANRTPAEDPILAMPTGPTIAVLPFVNMSGDPEQEYFSDGITEEIITELSRRSNLFVIARNSTFRYKGQSVDVRQVGQDLGARFVLEGSVRKSGDTVRVTAQLLDSGDGTHLWAETYDRELTGQNLFDVQDQITENVVGAIGGQYGAIHRANLQASRGKAPSSLEAYDCVLRAITLLRQFTSELHLSSRDCLERALEQDPDYADGWAWLAYLYHFEHSIGYNPRPNPLERGLMAAQRAISLDSSSQLGHQQMAYNYFLSKHEGFFDKANEAIAIDPNNSDVIGALGYYLSFAGEWEQGVALSHKAIALNPDHPGWVYIPPSINAYIQGDYREALRWAERVGIPGFFKTYELLAMSYGQLGMQEEAGQAAAQLLEGDPDYAENARRELGKYFWDETQLEHVLDGLRKAGLDITEEG